MTMLSTATALRSPAPSPPDPETCTFTTGERRIFRPKEKLTVSQWAERHRIVTNGPMTGKWRNDITPYLVEPMDTLNLPWVRQIILQFAPQTGKTQVAFNFLCYCIDQDPGPAMYIMPDEKVTKRIARRRIIPMFRSTPRIAELMSLRSDDTTTLAVQFINGMDFMMAWATSAAELSSESVQYLIRDEIDKFPNFSGKEADPRSLSDMRTNAYPYTKKILDMSTPTDESGLIGKAMDTEADEIRKRLAVCPICGDEQIMEFEQFNWPQSVRDPREIVRKRLASYQCRACGVLWDDYKRNLAVRAGRWQAELPVERPQCVGFYLPSWYSPFVSLSSVVAAHLRGLDDPGKKMVFVTQHEAKVWKETITIQEEDVILEHRTNIPPLMIPKEAVALTAGIDVQKHGFWFIVRAWAEDLTSWLIQYGFLASFEDVKTLIFQTTYQIEGSQNTMEIWRAAMDTGGGESESEDWTRTEEIYMWLRENGQGRVFGTKGSSRAQLQRVRTTVIDKLPRSNVVIPGGLELRLLDTDAFKGLLHWRLERGWELDAKGNRVAPKEESQRFFLHADTEKDYATQILAEQLCRDKKGRKFWKKVRRANHLLDAECLAAACADSSWLPSLRMLAAYLKQRQGAPKPVNVSPSEQESPQGGRREFTRPGWLNR